MSDQESNLRQFSNTASWGGMSMLDTSAFCEALRERTFDPAALIDWAHGYNGYHRLGSGPSALVKVLTPLVEEIAPRA